jgi:hypothetical protein
VLCTTYVLTVPSTSTGSNLTGKTPPNKKPGRPARNPTNCFFDILINLTWVKVNFIFCFFSITSWWKVRPETDRILKKMMMWQNRKKLSQHLKECINSIQSSKSSISRRCEEASLSSRWLSTAAIMYPLDLFRAPQMENVDNQRIAQCEHGLKGFHQVEPSLRRGFNALPCL